MDRLMYDDVFASLKKMIPSGGYERLLRELQSGRGLAAEADAITDVYSGSYTDADGNIQYFTGYYPYKEFGWWG